MVVWVTVDHGYQLAVPRCHYYHSMSQEIVLPQSHGLLGGVGCRNAGWRRNASLDSSRECPLVLYYDGGNFVLFPLCVLLLLGERRTEGKDIVYSKKKIQNREHLRHCIKFENK